MSEIQVFVDGACNPVNPGGIATYGYVVYRGNEKLVSRSGIVRKTPPSNNTAEYTALIEAMRWLKDRGLKSSSIVINSDSQLLVNQLKGVYRVQAWRILPLYAKVMELLRDFQDVRFRWIPREKNQEADALSVGAYRQFVSRHPEVLKKYGGATRR